MNSRVLNDKVILFILSAILIADTNIDSNNKYTWSNNTGWIDFNPTNGGVTVFPDHLEDYAWSDNIGWLKLSGENWGVIILLSE